jgi:hypothetical protein
VKVGEMSEEYLRELIQAEHQVGQSKKRKVDASKKTLDCECSVVDSSSLAFDTQGCLKCPKTDCAFYVQNFVETFLHCNNVDVYQIGTF